MPLLPLSLPFAPTAVSQDWFDWPALPDLFPTSYPGVKTSRDSFLVDTDLDRLKARVADYFDEEQSYEEIARRYPGVTRSTAGFNARPIRNALHDRGGPIETGFIRYAYRPFDTRWLYWEADSGLLDRPRSDYKPHVFEGNLWLEAREKEAREDFSRGTITRQLADNFGNGLSSFFPAWTRDIELGTDGNSGERLPESQLSLRRKPESSGADGNGVQRRPNLSPAAQRYLDRLDLGVEDLFYHALAVLHDPAYRRDNAGALRMEWPRIPLPGWPELADQPVVPVKTRPVTGRGTHLSDTPADDSVIPVKTGIHPNSDAAQVLAASAARGRQLARLLDSDTPVPGVTTGSIRPEIITIAEPATTDDRNMTGDDFGLTAGWGHYGSGEAVMPGQGRAVERAYTPKERDALSGHSGASRHPDALANTRSASANAAPDPEATMAVLGQTTYDIYLNDRAYWQNVPANVWHYKLGGYQVLKKWLSYREQTVLARPLKPEEVQHFTHTARRIGAILMLTAVTKVE